MRQRLSALHEFPDNSEYREHQDQIPRVDGDNRQRGNPPRGPGNKTKSTGQRGHRFCLLSSQGDDSQPWNHPEVAHISSRNPVAKLQRRDADQ